MFVRVNACATLIFRISIKFRFFCFRYAAVMAMDQLGVVPESDADPHPYVSARLARLKN